ncbi:MAG: hypothetical protein KBT68_05015 [bacterium]|nr:hypothetical protein [Candidatus Colisoma equi]
MAEEVEMIPVAGAEPPKADPLAKPVTDKPATISLAPVVRKPVVGAAPSAALKPGLKLPPKPATATGAFKPGLKLPTQTALKPGLKLPPKPVIRKPGATVAAAPLPKPITSVAAKPTAASVPAKPAAPVSVDAQGIGKLPTVSAATVARGGVTPVDLPKPMEALKSVTQKLKGVTQEIPQQAVLHKTGIISDGGMSESQKEAAKHKTARISLSDAMGVAPVKDEAAPMKTIRIKRPISIPTPTPTAALSPQPKAAAPAASVAGADAKSPDSAAPDAPASTATQRKTLKITRPGGTAVRPSGKFGIKRPTSTAAATPAAADAAAPADGAVADIADIPNIPDMPAPAAAAPALQEGPAWLWTLSAVVQAAACVVIGALAWFLYQNSQTMYF